jgi:hypothetical protein
MPAKMPLYHSEQLDEAGASLGRIERIFLFSAFEPDIIVDVEPVYEAKFAACLAHLSQFPKGSEDLEWMKELDRNRGQAFNIPYAEAFKELQVW